jgi:hypothetical protein
MPLLAKGFLRIYVPFVRHTEAPFTESQPSRFRCARTDILASGDAGILM